MAVKVDPGPSVTPRYIVLVVSRYYKLYRVVSRMKLKLLVPKDSVSSAYLVMDVVMFMPKTTIRIQDVRPNYC